MRVYVFACMHLHPTPYFFPIYLCFGPSENEVVYVYVCVALQTLFWTKRLRLTT
jgi:hypothetical protein